MVQISWGRASFAIFGRETEPMWGIGMKTFAMHDCAGILLFMARFGISCWYEGDSWLLKYPTHLNYSYASKNWFVVASLDRWGFGYWRETYRRNFVLFNIQLTMDIE